MNHAHYPTADRATKLKEIGFTATESWSVQELPFPSVMELLDVIPGDITMTREGIIDTENKIWYTRGQRNESLPNALCDLIIYLHKEGRISFKK